MLYGLASLVLAAGAAVLLLGLAVYLARFIVRRRRAALGIAAHFGIPRYQLDDFLDSTGLTLDELLAKLDELEGPGVTENRRSFLLRLRVLAFALATGGGNVHFYSAGSKVGQWAGWITNRAGEITAFFTRTGELWRWPR